MTHQAGALALAEAQVAAVRDDPSSRLALMARLFRGPTGHAPRHVRFRLAGLWNIPANAIAYGSPDGLKPHFQLDPEDRVVDGMTIEFHRPDSDGWLEAAEREAHDFRAERQALKELARAVLEEIEG